MVESGGAAVKADRWADESIVLWPQVGPGLNQSKSCGLETPLRAGSWEKI